MIELINKSAERETKCYRLLIFSASDILGEVVYQRFALKATAIPPPF